MASERGLISKVPSFATVNNYLADARLTPILKEFITTSSLPLKTVERDFCVDSSGFGTCRFVRWFDKRWGKQVDVREWVKVHLMVGTRTQIVTTVEIAGWETNDNPYFVPLVNATARHFEIGDVMADKGYLSRQNLKVVEAHGGTPYIPFKSSTIEPSADGSTWSRMYHLFAYQHEAWLKHYGQRQNVESTFARIKGKFGDAVRGKTQTAQVNEVLAKVLCHNICVVASAVQQLDVEPVFQAV